MRGDALLLGLALVLASGQRPSIDDQRSGPGTQFTEIQPALDIASPGDTVLVRAGDYLPASTGKGLRLIGERGAGMLRYPAIPYLFAVSGLPIGETFAMKGFDLTIVNSHTIPALRLLNNQGQVYLESLSLSGIPFSNSGSPALQIDSCAQVGVLRGMEPDLAHPVYAQSDDMNEPRRNTETIGPQARLTIGQVARAQGIPASTLRYYERAGLVKPLSRSGSNYRLYGPESLRRLAFIRSARAVGFVLEDIAVLLGLGDRKSCQKEVKSLLAKRLEETEVRLKDLQRVRKALRDALVRCERSREQCAVMLELDSEESRGAERT